MADHHQQQQLPPGFRFHPTDEELILHYLRNRAASAPCPVPIIADVDIYKFDPWDLPAKAAYGDGEYYFFSPRDRKYPNGIRPNRAAGSGYWKATGTDKPIHDADSVVGVKKALVFYRGRPPRGSKTNWIMHEYRLISSSNAATSCGPLAAAAGCYPRPPSKFRNNVSMRLDDWVLCRIYKKSGQASPMVPPLADYDHLDHDEPEPSSGGFDVFCGGLTTSFSSSSCSALVMPPHQQDPLITTRLPKIPSLSDLFDEYALAQIFDTAAPPAADHAPLAVHPSLNQLLAVGDSDSDLVYSPAAPAAAGAGKRSRAMVTTDECAGGGLHPPPPAKRLSVGSSCFDVAAPQQPAGGLPAAAAASVLGGLSHQYHNNHMLPQF